MPTEPKVPVGAFSTSAAIQYDPEYKSGWVPFVIRGTVTAAAAASGTVAAIPANCLVETAVITASAVGATPVTTGTHLGLGVTGDPDYFLEVIEASVDESDVYVDTTLPGAPKLQATATNMILASTNGSGAAAGSFTGTWYVHVTGKVWFGIES